VAYYDKEEQETVIVFEPDINQWDIYTTVPKHIRRLKNDYIASVFQEEKDSEGKTTGLRLKVEKLPSSYIFNR
jgi:nitrogenase subunit NifH